MEQGRNNEGVRSWSREEGMKKSKVGAGKKRQRSQELEQSICNVRDSGVGAENM